MNTTSRNTKSAPAQKLNRGAFAKFVNRKNAREKVAMPVPKPKIASIDNKK